MFLPYESLLKFCSFTHKGEAVVITLIAHEYLICIFVLSLFCIFMEVLTLFSLLYVPTAYSPCHQYELVNDNTNINCNFFMKIHLIDDSEIISNPSTCPKYYWRDKLEPVLSSQVDSHETEKVVIEVENYLKINIVILYINHTFLHQALSPSNGVNWSSDVLSAFFLYW